jgi:putative hydrolase of HD superfamily
VLFLTSNEEKVRKKTLGPDIIGTDLDKTKAILMALIHELGEVYAGDITPHDGITCEEKAKRERESLELLIGDMPDLRDIKSLWEEYEEGKSTEARFVKLIDKLEMGIQAKIYEAEGMEGAEDFFESVKSVLGDSPLIKAIIK